VCASVYPRTCQELIRLISSWVCSRVD